MTMMMNAKNEIKMKNLMTRTKRKRKRKRKRRKKKPRKFTAEW
jgi:hypothetical protein